MSFLLGLYRTGDQTRPPSSPAGQLRWHSSSILRWIWRDKVAASPLVPGRLRRSILRAAGLDVRTTGMVDHCFIGTKLLSIGLDTFVNRGCFFEGAGRIEIGDNCMFGPEVMILTSNHALKEDGTITLAADYRPVTIGDRCWIGARATILPGVTIHEGVVVAAGAVVAGDCEAHSIYGGVPAKRIRSTRRDAAPVT